MLRREALLEMFTSYPIMINSFRNQKRIENVAARLEPAIVLRDTVRSLTFLPFDQPEVTTAPSKLVNSVRPFDQRRANPTARRVDFILSCTRLRSLRLHFDSEVVKAMTAEEIIEKYQLARFIMLGSIKSYSIELDEDYDWHDDRIPAINVWLADELTKS